MQEAEQTILVVDDEAAICDLMSIFLGRGGFRVEMCAGGWEAIERIKALQPAFVLSDIRMERGDGIELLENIQNLPRPRPIVGLMSGYADVTMADLLNRGAAVFLAKPLNFDCLAREVQAALAPREIAWAAARPVPANAPLFTRKYPSIAKAVAAGDIDFGNGGFFLAASEPGVPAETVVRFSLTSDDGCAGIRRQRRGALEPPDGAARLPAWFRHRN